MGTGHGGLKSRARADEDMVVLKRKFREGMGCRCDVSRLLADEAGLYVTVMQLDALSSRCNR
jgi:hypothetical protein